MTDKIFPCRHEGCGLLFKSYQSRYAHEKTSAKHKSVSVELNITSSSSSSSNSRVDHVIDDDVTCVNPSPTPSLGQIIEGIAKDMNAVPEEQRQQAYEYIQTRYPMTLENARQVCDHLSKINNSVHQDRLAVGQIHEKI